MIYFVTIGVEEDEEETGLIAIAIIFPDFGRSRRRPVRSTAIIRLADDGFKKQSREVPRRDGQKKQKKEGKGFCVCCIYLPGGWCR